MYTRDEWAGEAVADRPLPLDWLARWKHRLGSRTLAQLHDPPYGRPPADPEMRERALEVGRRLLDAVRRHWV